MPANVQRNVLPGVSANILLNSYCKLKSWTHYIFLYVYIQVYDSVTVCKSLCIYMSVYGNFAIYTLITCI